MNKKMKKSKSTSNFKNSWERGIKEEKKSKRKPLGVWAWDCPYSMSTLLCTCE